MTIIAVDDERHALESLEMAIREALPDENPVCFSRALDALEFARENMVDVAFLDISIGGMDGVELAERLIELCPTTNIIFVTGYSDYMVEAFELHASGYVKKPVRAERILSEMNNLRYPPDRTTDEPRYRSLGPYSFDHVSQRVYIDGCDALLTQREYLLFHLLAANPGVYFTADELFERVWGEFPVGNISTVKMHISNLRRKLEISKYDEIEILAQRGKGYCLNWNPKAQR